MKWGRKQISDGKQFQMEKVTKWIWAELKSLDFLLERESNETTIKENAPTWV